MTWPAEPVTVQAPATCANLGPGFDSFGLAVSLHDTVRARVIPAGVEIQVTGVGAGKGGHHHEQNLIIRAMRRAFDAIGVRPPGLALWCRNEVPQGYGLGSSAAAIVAGLLAARALAADRGLAALDDAALLRLASELEGHPDNVAACLAGGLTIAWQTASGPKLVRLAPLASLVPVVCLAEAPLATATARLALPNRVPHADAAANSARAALLVAALTSRPELLLDATEDYLHQSYRGAAMPATARLLGRLRAAGVPAVVSGAGPAVLALTEGGGGPDAADVASVAARDEADWMVLPLAIDAEGARQLPTPAGR